MKVAVFGLGYVGSVTAGCLTSLGHDVIGVDVVEAKVCDLARGEPSVSEPGLRELCRGALNAGRLTATTNGVQAAEDADVSMICVGTPSRSSGDVDLQHVEAVAQQIGQGIKASRGHHSVVVRSTVFPSTVRGLVYPLLLREVQPDSGDRVGIAMNPEFLREGTAVADFKDAFATVIGVNDPRTEKTLRELYAGLSAPIIVTDIETAEMVKYACNAYHALKVAFGNEIGRIAAAAGIDSHKVMDVFVRDDKLNLSAAYLRPGYAFGGSCLPKDLRALTYRAQKSGCSVPMLNAVLESNEEEINRAVGAVLSLGQKDVGLVGLAFKHGTTDLRESPMVALAERLIDAGCEVRAYDRILARELLIGQNEAYAAAHLSDWRDRLVENVDDLLAQSDVIVLSAYEATVAELLEERHTVVDLQYHPACARTAAKYISLNWHIPANATANSTGKQW